MKTFVLNLSDSATAFLWKEVKIRCDIPVDTDCVKVIGTIDFKNVEFDREFYNAIKGKIDILDLSELKSSSSYDSLRLGLNQCSEYGFGGNELIHKYESLSVLKEIILPNNLNNIPMIRGLQELRKIVGRGLSTFDSEQETDYWGGRNLSGCPKLEEIIFGSAIRNISIRNSSIKRLNIPESNGLLQLEPYGLAYNNELEEVHIPQDMKELPIRLFEGCEKLRIVTGGNGIERIGFGAFGGCVSLQSVPFRIELLNENQFFTYGEWMQYEPEEYPREYGDCANCPKGKWSENNHEWERKCNFWLNEYCRDINQCKWKPIKKGVVLKDDYIWCFNDFSYYKKDWHCKYPYANHKYVEFTSPSITFTSEGDHVNINHNPQEKIAYELSYPVNRLAETIAFFFEDISYELILNKITQKVDQLDIEAIIDSYETKYSYKTFKMNSDTEGEEFRLDRDAKYTDEYLAILLPPIHTYYNDRTACLSHPTGYINPYKKKYDFESYYNTFGKKEVFHSYEHKDVDNLKKEDEKIRKEARRKYNRKDHIDFLVNCRISEITNKKLDIESRLHIKQAENDFSYSK